MSSVFDEFFPPEVLDAFGAQRFVAAMPEAFERGLGVWQAEQADWAQLLISAHASANALCQSPRHDATPPPRTG